MRINVRATVLVEQWFGWREPKSVVFERTLDPEEFQGTPAGRHILTSTRVEYSYSTEKEPGHYVLILTFALPNERGSIGAAMSFHHYLHIKLSDRKYARAVGIMGFEVDVAPEPGPLAEVLRIQKWI